MLAVLACLLQVNAQQFVSTSTQNRNAIIEEFTGRNCGYCPDGHVIANNIVHNNPGRVWAVNVHAGGYAPTSYPNFNTDVSTNIMNGFSVQSFPSGVVNRSTATAQGRGSWESLTNQQLSQTAECNVGGQAIINPLTRTAKINVEVYYTSNSASSTNYLTIVMLQDSIWGSQSGGSLNPDQYVGGQYCHMHILRDAITADWGDQISPTTAGTLISKEYMYQIPESIGSPNGVAVDLDNIIFLAYVSEKYQGTPTRAILNVNELNTMQGSEEDLYPYITNVAPTTSISCSTTKTMKIDLVNGGLQTLTSLKLQAKVGNSQPVEFDWNGNVPSYGLFSIEKDLNVPFGSHIVEVKIIQANGTAFEFSKETVIDSEEWTEVQIDGEKEELTIDIMQDKYGNQTTWELIASDYSVIASGGPYTMLVGGSTATQLHTEKATVNSGDCVKFVIKDNIGNGICCQYGEGYYQIKDSKGNILVDGDGAFGSEASVLLSIQGNDDGEDDGDDDDDDNNGEVNADYVSTTPQNRNLLIEEFTGRNCPNCPAGHIISSGITHDNPGRAWSMGIHSGYFAVTTYPNFNTDISAIFTDPYDDVQGGLGYPAAVLNRSTEEALGRGYWEAAAAEQLQIAAECNVGGHVTIDPITRKAYITTEVYYTANSAESTNYLTIVMLQDSIAGQQAYGHTNPAQDLGDDMYCHMHVLRDVVTSSWGDAITPTTEGSLVKKTYEYSIPEIIGDPNGVTVDLDNIYFIAFVTEKYQGMPTRPILNVNKLSQEQSTGMAVSPYISDLVMEEGVFCANSRTFKNYVKNVGSSALTSMKFEVKTADGNVVEHSWEGNIAPDATERIDITLDIPFGNNEIDFNIVEANAQSHDYTKSVMALCDEWDEYDTGCIEEIPLTIEIMQDKYGNHTTWEFLSSDNTVLISGGPYSYLPNANSELHTYTVNVMEDCYKFVIYDSYGNGICCGEDGDGYYRILDEGGNIVVDGNGEFEDIAYSILSVKTSGSVNDVIASAYNIYPNPAKDMITVKGVNMSQIKVYNALGQMVKAIDCDANEMNINVNNMQNGIYFINITNDKGEMTTSKVSIQH